MTAVANMVYFPSLHSEPMRPGVRIMCHRSQVTRIERAIQRKRKFTKLAIFRRTDSVLHHGAPYMIASKLVVPNEIQGYGKGKNEKESWQCATHNVPSNPTAGTRKVCIFCITHDLPAGGWGASDRTDDTDGISSGVIAYRWLGAAGDMFIMRPGHHTLRECG